MVIEVRKIGIAEQCHSILTPFLSLFFPPFLSEALKGVTKSVTIFPPDKTFLHADGAACPKYVALLKEIWPGFRVVEREGFDAGAYRGQGRAGFTFHVDYWRAVAKIGFHYYLLNTRRGVRGDEPEFADLRRFIIEGG